MHGWQDAGKTQLHPTWECRLPAQSTYICTWLELQYASSYGCGAFNSQFSLMCTGAAIDSSWGCALLLLLLVWPTDICRGCFWQEPFHAFSLP
jgi:hypothetical protein